MTIKAKFFDIGPRAVDFSTWNLDGASLDDIADVVSEAFTRDDLGAWVFSNDDARGEDIHKIPDHGDDPLMIDVLLPLSADDNWSPVLYFSLRELALYDIEARCDIDGTMMKEDSGWPLKFAAALRELANEMEVETKRAVAKGKKKKHS